jgi:hypothetical protein
MAFLVASRIASTRTVSQIEAITENSYHPLDPIVQLVIALNALSLHHRHFAPPGFKASLNRMRFLNGSMA